MTLHIQPHYRTLGAFAGPSKDDAIAILARSNAETAARSEELRAAYERIAQLESALSECLDYFEERSDVVDGDYGEPRPNAEMKMMCAIDEVL